MENKKRLIWDEDALRRIAALAVKRRSDLIPMDMITYILFNESPTVDAVPVDQIRVNFKCLYLKGQEAILNVSICGNDNEVRIPFEKEVVEAVHGRWDEIPNKYISVSTKTGSYSGHATSCSVCHEINPNAFKTNYCPNCGAKMDGEM